MAYFLERFNPFTRREQKQPASVHPEPVQPNSGALNQDRIRLFTVLPKEVKSSQASDEHDPDASFRSYVSRLNDDYKKFCEATTEALDKNLMDTRPLFPDEVE